MYFFIVRELRRNITLIIDPIDDVPNFLWPQFLDNSLYEIKTIDLPGSTRGSSRVRSIGQFISLTFVRYRGTRLAYYFRRFRCCKMQINKISVCFLYCISFIMRVVSDEIQHRDSSPQYKF